MKLLITGACLTLIAAAAYAADFGINPSNIDTKALTTNLKQAATQQVQAAAPQAATVKQAASDKLSVAKKVKVDVSKIAKKDTPPAEKDAAKEELVGMGKQAQPYIEQAKAAAQDKDLKKQLDDVLSKIKGKK